MKILKSIWSFILTWILYPVGKFLKFVYASEITLAVIAVIIFLGPHKLWGFLLFGWTILLFINQIKEAKK